MKNTKKNKITRKEMAVRSMAVLLFVTFLFVVCVGSLVNVQLVKSDTFKYYAEKNQLEDKPVPSCRGTIYDCNMNVLAQSASVWRVYVNPNNFLHEVNDKSDAFNELAIKSVSKKLAEIFELDENDISRKIVENKDYKYVAIKKQVEKPLKDKVTELMGQEIKRDYTDEEGNRKTESAYYNYFIGIESDTKRYYPDGKLASALIGFTGDGDIGRCGIEAAYDSILTGTDGRVIYSNKPMNANASLDFESAYDAVPGSSLVLTIDETIQRYLDDALDQCYIDSNCASCYGIVMDVDTGAVLAMSSKNDFNPNSPDEICSERINAAAELITDKTEKTQFLKNAREAQWRNNAVSDFYEPGSVFKLITLSAAIEEGEALDHLFCAGSIQIDDRLYYCHNHAGHGDETLNQGLANSCNPYYITMGQNLGINRFNKYFEAFGFTEKTGIDVGGEEMPSAPSTYHDFSKMSRVDLASSSFGQSFTVSAIQMITAVNAIGNGGKLMKPYVVAKTLDEDNNVIKETQPVVKRQVISESTSKRVLEAMVETVKTGTAKNAYVAGYNVAGKTGTSDNLVKAGEYVASFAGIAPADNPEISIIIVVDEPKGETGGGAVAAPVAAEVIENTLTYLNVKRNYTPEEASELKIPVPNFVGSDITKALSTAAENNLTVKVIGDGANIISQCPSYGQFIPQNGTVAVYTQENSDKYMVTVPDFTGMSISQATMTAVQNGLNVKITGNSLQSVGLVAFKQSVDAATEIEYGSTVTVYFKTDTGITDR